MGLLASLVPGGKPALKSGAKTLGNWLGSSSGATKALDKTADSASAAVKGVADFAESAGRLGGKLWGADRIPALTRYLEKRGVKVMTNQDELLSKLAKQRGLDGTDAAFVVGKDGKMWFLLSKNPTRREVPHELSHFLHRQKVGAGVYSNLTTPQKETWASNFLRDSNNWKQFTPEEQWREMQNLLKYTE